MPPIKLLKPVRILPKVGLNFPGVSPAQQLVEVALAFFTFDRVDLVVRRAGYYYSLNEFGDQPTYKNILTGDPWRKP